jgi:hypothetical protein
VDLDGDSIIEFDGVSRDVSTIDFNIGTPSRKARAYLNKTRAWRRSAAMSMMMPRSPGAR